MLFGKALALESSAGHLWIQIWMQFVRGFPAWGWELSPPLLFSSLRSVTGLRFIFEKEKRSEAQPLKCKYCFSSLHSPISLLSVHLPSLKQNIETTWPWWDGCLFGWEIMMRWHYHGRHLTVALLIRLLYLADILLIILPSARAEEAATCVLWIGELGGGPYLRIAMAAAQHHETAMTSHVTSPGKDNNSKFKVHGMDLESVIWSEVRKRKASIVY